jgi:hypothetical protein
MKELGKANSLDAAMMDKKSGKNGSKKKKRNA